MPMQQCLHAQQNYQETWAYFDKKNSAGFCLPNICKTCTQQKRFCVYCVLKVFLFSRKDREAKEQIALETTMRTVISELVERLHFENILCDSVQYTYRCLPCRQCNLCLCITRIHNSSTKPYSRIYFKHRHIINSAVISTISFFTARHKCTKRHNPIVQVHHCLLWQRCVSVAPTP